MAKMYGAQQRQQMQAPSNPLAIKTKKYGLEKNKYISYSLPYAAAPSNDLVFLLQEVLLNIPSFPNGHSALAVVLLF
jgi:hypothetical protein